MRILICLAGLFLTAAFCGETPTVQGSYPVQLTPSEENKAKGTDKAYPDVIVIKDGMLTTDVSKKQGFKEGEIAVTVEGDKIKITGTLVGRGKGRYELELKDGVISGKLIWDCDPGSQGGAKHAEYVISARKVEGK